jgi:hypothetical protein
MWVNMVHPSIYHPPHLHPVWDLISLRLLYLSPAQHPSCIQQCQPAHTPTLVPLPSISL